ncbi:Protein of unknown function DUF3441 [Carpediemonas membranifera]|uniref:Ribosome quality control complex subunit 2 n=1 Tax=Carpediemonas membranifera TaxID=201153 RepID=A0A8J6BFW9_9EUKA|nr:Protein of unknown function DUF3441 [Carpediemonas membranifera]|eukprot:KAG9396642.1 Protein of unknown function DUF3441 [Carpediemonas membranifera]
MGKKARFSSIDVSVLCKNMRDTLTGHRLANIYDISDRALVLKFYVPSSGADSGAITHVMIENGLRVHMTKFVRQNPPAPKSFTMKLRKHLKSHRLTNVIQFSNDRIIDLIFGEGAFTHHLIVELHSKGNVILCGDDMRIKALFRHQQGVFNGDMYSTSAIRPPVAPTVEFINTLVHAPEHAKETVRNIILNNMDYGPTITASVVRQAGLGMGVKAASERVTPEVIADISTMLMQVDALKEGAAQAAGIVLADEAPVPAGLIVPADSAAVLDADNNAVTALCERFEEFVPFQLPWDTRTFIPLSSFNEAVDVFFSLEAWLLEVHGAPAEAEQEVKDASKDRAKLTREERFKADQLKRRAACQARAQEWRAKGAALEASREAAEEVRCMWEKIYNSKKVPMPDVIRWVPVVGGCSMTHWDFNDKSMTIAVPALDGEGTVEIVLFEPHASVDKGVAACFYAAKVEEEMMAKIDEAMETVAKKMRQQKVADQVKPRAAPKAQVKVKHQRPKFWFERYRWFISSDNILVVGGRDAHQNEQLVKGHLRENDIYLHAETVGAASVVFALPPKLSQPPPDTLREAAMFASMWSSSWAHKVVPAVYWVWGRQVSKTAPTGEYIGTGAFMIRGSKSYIRPSSYDMAIGVLYRVDEASAQSHAGERARQYDLAAMAKELKELLTKVDEEVIEEFRAPQQPKNRKKREKKERKEGKKVEEKAEEPADTPETEGERDPSDAEIDYTAVTRSRRRRARLTEYGLSDEEPVTGKEKKAAEKAQKKADAEAANPTVCVVCGAIDHVAADCPRRHDKPRVSKREKARQAPSLAQTSTELIDQLTANPTEEDAILGAVPIVAPASTMTDWALKFPLKFWKTKKTAVAKDMVHRLSMMAGTEGWPANIQVATKAVSVDAVVDALPVDATLR